MSLKNLALLFPPIRRLQEDRARLIAELREMSSRLAGSQKECAQLRAALDEERTASHEVRSALVKLQAESARLHSRPIQLVLEQMQRCGIDLVVDVGGNKGQYVEGLRREGFRGEIVSFEPLSDAFATLQGKCEQVDNWSCHKIAIGDADGEATINISENSHSSSLLPVCDWTLEAEPSIAYVGQEVVAVRRLDGLVRELGDARHIFLKSDTQGFESRVIEGARAIFDRVAMVQMELAWKPTYEGQAELVEMVTLMKELGFEPTLTTPAWVDGNGVVREVDVVFTRVAPDA